MRHYYNYRFFFKLTFPVAEKPGLPGDMGVIRHVLLCLPCSPRWQGSSWHWWIWLLILHLSSLQQSIMMCSEFTPTWNLIYKRSLWRAALLRALTRPGSWQGCCFKARTWVWAECMVPLEQWSWGISLQHNVHPPPKNTKSSDNFMKNRSVSQLP